MYPHRINLREPWTALPHPDGSLHRRAFRWPTELMPFEQLWLVVGWANSPIEVHFNQKSIGSQKVVGVPLELNLTEYVQNQNILEIACHRKDPAGSVNKVFLEVRRSVHLGGIMGTYQWYQGRPSLGLHAHIMGEVERKLSIVIRINDKEVHYEEVGLEKTLQVSTGPLDVPVWQPGRENRLERLDIELLDPSCVLSQHHYLTACSDAATSTNHSLIVMPEDEPILDSSFLESADRQGQLVQLRRISYAAGHSYLWHHPCLQHHRSSV